VEAFYKWVDRLIDFSVKTRLKEPTFLLDLAYDGYVRHNDTFRRLVSNLGSPLIRNKQQEYFSIKPNGIKGWTCEVMKSVKQIHDLLHDGMMNCSLYPWCVNSDRELAGTDGYVPIEPTIEVCLHKPWERCECKELCPFAMLWKNWYLVGHIPIK